MPEKKLDSGRRRFLATALPLGTIACLGCKRLLALPGFDGRPFTSGQASKFAENPGMTAEEIFRYFYGLSIPVFQTLARDIGRDKLIKELTKASAENYARMVASMAKDLPRRDVKAFADMLQSMLSGPLDNKAYTYEVVSQTDKVFEVKFAQCLPAKIWREMNAADLGYALECSSADAITKAFNPKILATNPKNLMKGDSFCTLRFELV
jgi:hypothetical protein